MEVIYRNGYDGYANDGAFCGDCCDAGPLLYRVDPNAADFFQVYQNPLMEISKPQIITFKDFKEWFDPIDYKRTLDWLLHTKQIGVGRRRGMPQSDIDYSVVSVRLHREHLIRLDMTSFCHDVIIIAEVNAHCNYRFVPMTEWYRFRNVRTVRNSLQGELVVTVYDPADNILGRSLLDSLAPDLGYGNREIEDFSAEMLTEYYNYNKAFLEPGRINAYELADNLGYTVRETFLSPERHMKGRVVFEENDIPLFDPIAREMKYQTIKERTILIDPAANQGQHYNSTEDSIVHECDHVYSHQLFYAMQKIYNDRLEIGGMDYDLETLILENNEREELRTIERQARGLVPRIRMPAGQFQEQERHFQQENDRRYYNHGRAVEKTTSQLAVYYGTSRESTRNRQKELGNTEVNGVLVYCNGHYLPRHSWSAQLKYNESYSIESNVLNGLRVNDPVLNVILSYELFVYVDGFVCLNNPDYVTSGKWGRKLTPKALKDVSVCCLKFTLHNEHEDNEFTYGVLNNIDKRRMASAEISQSSIDQVYQRAVTRYDLPLKIHDEFIYTIKKNMEIVGLTEGELQELSMIEDNRLHKILRGAIKGVTVGEVVAIGLSLGMIPEEIIDLVDKSPSKWENCLYHEIIKAFIHEHYRETVHTFNQALIKCNQLPLVDESLAFKRKPPKNQMVAMDTAKCSLRP